jgi:Tfp pilus assembly protein PilF
MIGRFERQENRRMAANDKQELANQLGAAWELLRNKKSAEAVQAFETILTTHPTLIDGLYGMGLAQATNGQHDLAIKSFETCRRMTQRELEKHPGADRYEMLERMCAQRIDDLRQMSGVAAAVNPA